MNNDFTQLYKAQQQTIEDISRAICEKRGLPYHEIAEVCLMQQIAGLENLYQAVPNSMLADHYVFASPYRNNFNSWMPLNNEQIAYLDKLGYWPQLASADTSNKPIFIYTDITLNPFDSSRYSFTGYYIGNYIT